MERTYRVESVTKTGRRAVLGYYHTTLDHIKSVMENHIVGHPTIEIFFKTGKVVQDRFQG